MLEAHLLSHMLAASLAAAQPAPASETPVVQTPVAVDAGSAAAPAAPPPALELPERSETVAPAASAPVGSPTLPPATAPVAALPAAPAPVVNPATMPGLRDPLEGVNRIGYKISQPIDRFIIRPAAMAYKTVIPHPLRDGARNFIRNLFEPVVFLNDLLQLRPKRALHTLARLVLNTAVGIGGTFDVAKRPPFHLVHHDNGFGDTLGYYGIGPIAYVYLPVLGPTTLRDMLGEVGDAYAEPRLLEHLVHPRTDKPLLRAKLHLGQSTAIVAAVSGLDRRAESDDELQAITRTSVDPYAALRSSYLQNRAGEIAALKARTGHLPINPSLEDPLADPAGK